MGFSSNIYIYIYIPNTTTCTEDCLIQKRKQYERWWLCWQTSISRTIYIYIYRVLYIMSTVPIVIVIVTSSFVAMWWQPCVIFCSVLFYYVILFVPGEWNFNGNYWNWILTLNFKIENCILGDCLFFVVWMGRVSRSVGINIDRIRIPFDSIIIIIHHPTSITILWKWPRSRINRIKGHLPSPPHQYETIQYSTITYNLGGGGEGIEKNWIGKRKKENIRYQLDEVFCCW